MRHPRLVRGGTLPIAGRSCYSAPRERETIAAPASMDMATRDRDDPYSSDYRPGSRLMDDLGRLMTDAAGVAQGMRREVDAVVRTQIERLLRDLDVVTRDEFEAALELARRARADNERLEARVAALEAKLAQKS